MNKLFAGASVKACLCLVVLLTFANCAKVPEKAKAVRQSSGVATETALLATIAHDDNPPPTPIRHDPASPEVQPESFQELFSETGRGVVYLVQKGDKVAVVHKQSRGKEYAAIGTVVLNPDGKRVAYAARVDSAWSMVVDGKEGRRYDGLLTPVFSPDGQHVMYQAKAGDTWYLVVDDTQNAGTKASYTTPEFSSDSTRIVFVEAADSSSEMKLIVSDLAFGNQNIKKSIGDLLFTTNRAKTRIAATQVVDKKLRVFDFSFSKPEVVREGKLYDVIDRLVIGDDAESLAYCALKDGKRLLVQNDREESLPKGVLPELPVIRPDNKGVGLLLGYDKKISLHQSFYNGTAKAKKYDEAASLSYSRDSRSYAYAARSGQNWFVVANGTEGPAFDKVVTPLFSPDGKFLVYRARKDNKRFVVIADTDGKTIRQHPAYEQVFDLHLTADGGSVAYGVKDGRQLIWKVEKL